MMTDRINRDENKNYNDKAGLQGDENTWHQVNHKTEKKKLYSQKESNNTAKNNLKEL